MNEDRGGHARPRITIVTNGNYFARLGLRDLLNGHNRHWDLQVVITTGLRRQRGNRIVEAIRLARRWGGRYTAYKFSTYLLPAFFQLFSRSHFGVAHLCQTRGIPHFRCRNVNDSEPSEAVAGHNPALLISFSCPYKIQNALLDLPLVGAINVHSSMLPRHAGVCTYIHALAEGRTTTGVTVHEMVERFDAGRILEQAPVVIPPRTSVFHLFSEQCRIASTLLARAVFNSLATGSLVGRPQDEHERSYCREPARADITRLHRNGHGLFHWGDLRRMRQLVREELA